MLRSTIFSLNWWISTALSTIVIMCFIVLLKKLTKNVPVVGAIAQEV